MDVWIFHCFCIFMTCLHLLFIFLLFFVKIDANSVAILMSEEVRKCITVKLLLLSSLLDISQCKVEKYTRTILVIVVLIIIYKILPKFLLIDPTAVSVLLQLLHKSIFWIVSIIFQICMKRLLSLPQFNHIISQIQRNWRLSVNSSLFGQFLYQLVLPRQHYPLKMLIAQPEYDGWITWADSHCKIW